MKCVVEDCTARAIIKNEQFKMNKVHAEHEFTNAITVLTLLKIYRTETEDYSWNESAEHSAIETNSVASLATSAVDSVSTVADNLY